MARRSLLTLAAAVPAALAQTQQRDWSTRRAAWCATPIPISWCCDKRFAKYKINNAPIRRGLRTACLGRRSGLVGRRPGTWVWSDIPNNAQMRLLEEDGHISTYRNPSGQQQRQHFDFQGPQLACEHAGRRVVRYEHDGSVTVLADKYNGKPLNAPNDIVVHPDGGIWFTDPAYGILGNYEGFQAKQEIKEAVYRIDPQTGNIELVTDAIDKPNGLCFSPDYKKLYIVDTGAPRNIRVFNLTAINSVADGCSRT